MLTNRSHLSVISAGAAMSDSIPPPQATAEESEQPLTAATSERPSEAPSESHSHHSGEFTPPDSSASDEPPSSASSPTLEQQSVLDVLDDVARYEKYDDPDADVTSEIIRDLQAVRSPTMPNQPIDELLKSRPQSPAPVMHVIASPQLKELSFPTPPKNRHVEETKEVEQLEAELTSPMAIAASAAAAHAPRSYLHLHSSQPRHPHPPAASADDPSVLAEAASVVSSLSHYGSPYGYTGLLKNIALSAEKSSVDRARKVAPRVRQVLAEGVEQARMEKVTERWREFQSGYSQGRHTKELPEEQKGDSPFKPSRARPTILSNSVLSASPSAPKIAGVPQTLSPPPTSRSTASSAVVTTRGLRSTEYRANQLAREHDAVIRAENRKGDPFFQPPSTSPPSSHHRAYHPNKPPMAISVASSSFAFYATAHQPPIQVEFTPRHEEYPRAMDMAPYLVSPRRKGVKERTQVHQSVQQTTTTSTSVRHEQQFYAHQQPPDSPLQQQHPHAAEYAQPFAQERLHTGETYQPSVAPFVIPSPRGQNIHLNHPHHGPSQSHTPHHHHHMSLGNSPVPHTPLSPRYAASRASGFSHAFVSPVPSASSLSAALVRQSEYATNLQTEIRPLFSSYHSYKSTLLKKKASITQEVEEHAHQHLRYTETRRTKRQSTQRQTAAQVLMIDRGSAQG